MSHSWVWRLTRNNQPDLVSTSQNQSKKIRRNLKAFSTSFSTPKTAGLSSNEFFQSKVDLYFCASKRILLKYGTLHWDLAALLELCFTAEQTPSSTLICWPFLLLS